MLEALANVQIAAAKNMSDKILFIKASDQN